MQQEKTMQQEKHNMGVPNRGSDNLTFGAAW